MKVLNCMMSKKLGGLEEAFVAYSNGLLKSGHELVNVIRKGAMIRNAINKISNSIVEVSCINKFDIFCKLKILSIAREHGVDVIIGHSDRAIRMCSFAKKVAPLIGTLHTDYDISSASLCNHVVSVNSKIRDRILKSGQNVSVSIIPNMIKLDRTKYSSRRSVTNKPLIIGVLARLVKEKGIDILLNAISVVVLSGYRDLHLKIGGDGDQIDELRDLVIMLGLQNIVKFCGWIDDKDQFYDSIDLLCIPSRRDTFSIVMIEAMSRGIPIIATKFDGAIENLTDNVNAIIVDIEDTKCLADRIIDVINNKYDLSLLIQNAFNRVQSFDVETVSKKIVHVIESEVKKSLSC